MSVDNLLCKHTRSIELICKNPAKDSPVKKVKKVDIMSDAIRERGQSPDSQETISDNNLSLEIDEKEISKNLHLDELQTSKGFSGNPDLLDSKCYLESSESDCHSSESL